MRIVEYNKGIEVSNKVLDIDEFLKEVLMSGPTLVTIHDDAYESHILESPTYRDMQYYYYSKRGVGSHPLEIVRIDDDIKEINLFPKEILNLSK